MSSNPRARIAPRDAAHFHAEVARLERELQTAEHQLETARAALPALKVAGDEVAEAAARREISRHAAAVQALEADLTATRDAALLAIERDRTAAASQGCCDLERIGSDAVRAVGALEDAIDKAGALLQPAFQALEDFDAKMVALGSTPNLAAGMRARLQLLVELRLWLASDGLLGEKRTLDNAFQLRQNGRAELEAPTQDFVELEVHRVRRALRLPDDPPEAA